MELILLKDIENLGFKDDIVTVKPGYGRNFLIPQKMGVIATPSAKKSLETMLAHRLNKENEIIEEAKVKADKIKSLNLSIAVKAGSDGKLFGSVNAISISDALQEQDYFVDKKYIKINSGTIKILGRYVASIRLHRQVNVEFEFDVVAETVKQKK